MAAILLGGTACGERGEPIGANLSVYPVRLTDARDHRLTVTRRPHRIAALTASAAALLGELGAGRRLVGPRRGYFGPTGELVLSRLRGIKPDLVVAPASDDRDEPALAKLRVPVYFAPQSSIRDVEHAVTQLGLIVGEPVAARRVVHRIEQARRRIAMRVGSEPRVSVFVDTGFFTTAADTSLVGDLVREAGGRNIAGAESQPGPFDLEKLRRLDPAVYLATSDSGTTLSQLRRDRRTRTLRAVRTGRFATIDAALLEPTPKIAAALLEIARVLHPHAFR